MSRGINLSILGLYSYDNTIFDGLSLPSQIDKQLFIDNLISELGELEVVYPDVNFMKTAIKFWSNARLYAWEKIAIVLYKDYDPFINIMRDEERIILEERDLEGTNKGDNTTNVNAWNDGSGVEREKVKGDFTSTDKGTIKTTEKVHFEGDSAITDAQDVARKEIDMRTQYDLYKYIINDFKNRFCLLVY